MPQQLGSSASHHIRQTGSAQYSSSLQSASLSQGVTGGSLASTQVPQQYAVGSVEAPPLPLLPFSSPGISVPHQSSSSHHSIWQTWPGLHWASLWQISGSTGSGTQAP